jgi:hypothetical protein
MPAFRSALCRLLPKSRLEWGLYLFILLCAIRPWALSWILFPHDPPSVRVIYHSSDGDFEYYILINTMAKGNFGEHAIYESRGTGVQSFPFASMIYHVLGTALLGPLGGYILADIVVTFLFFFIFRSWCRLFSPDELWTSFLAALFASGFPQIIDGFGGRLVHIGAVWGDRIPRPFVSDIYLIAGIVLLTWMIWTPQIRNRIFPWLLLGAVLALNLQSLVFLMPTLGIGAAFVILEWILEDRRAFPIILARIGYAGLSFFVLILPFIYQRAFESPDGPGRLGVFPIDRWFIWFHTPWARDCSVLSGLIILGILALSNASAKRWNLPTIPGRVLGLLAAMQLAAFLALPLTATLTGKLIQAYHFFGVTAAVQTCLLVALVACVGPRFMPKALRNPVPAGILLLFGFCLVPYHVIHRHLLTGPIRTDMNTPPGPEYHHAFTSLARELDRDIYKDDQVMATIDDQLYAYWVGFHGRYAFFPQNWISTLSNHEMEDRLLWFAREEGFDNAALARFLDQHNILTYWLGTSLYQCSPLYHKEPLADYSEEDIKNNMQGPLDFGGFTLALPLSEIHRLQTRYAQILAMDEKEKPRLDLIILSANAKLLPLPDPDPSRYFLTYHDDYFRVWKAFKSPAQR